MAVVELRRLRQLEEENHRLKRQPGCWKCTVSDYVAAAV
ncbi:hypothetical protein [Pectobacterium sp. F1-1]